ncbi:MAG: CsgG/HfaB family protein [Candidatus Cloacimonetes bacterium]|nr:CsgG/HfaB family protein [Candidatus Cloacimonadota bacterium]
MNNRTSYTMILTCIFIMIYSNLFCQIPAIPNAHVLPVTTRLEINRGDLPGRNPVQKDRAEQEALRERSFAALLSAASLLYPNVKIHDVQDIRWDFVESRIRGKWNVHIYELRGLAFSYITSSIENTDAQPMLSIDPIDTHPTNNQTGIEGALERAVSEAFINIDQSKRIAIVQITVQDITTRDFIRGEIEHILRRRAFRIVDRVALDMLLEEQTLQIGGDFDERTAVNIGRLAGADFIVTGSIDGEDSLRRLRLRVIEVETAELVGTASEQF